MPKIQNNFTAGIIDKDSDERLVKNGFLIDAENFLVSTTEGSNAGVGKNTPGNKLVSNYDFSGAKTIGSGKNESKNKIYNFIKATNYDYIIEFDVETEISVIVLQSSTNGVLNFKQNERILNVDLISGDEENEDLLAWSGDSNPPRIVNISRAKTWSIDGFTEDEISVMKPAPIFAPSINLTISNEGVDNNFIRDRFLCFAYRYKYNDGFYSAPSAWSKIAFEPNRFSLDYQTYENNGMLNIANSADITFNVGERDVESVDLLFRDSNTSTVYVIESFNKSKEGWSDNSNQTFKFSKSKIFKVLPEEQYFRNFDNVPLSAYAQTIIGNRIAYANYIEGYDLNVDIDFDATFVSSDPFSSETNAAIQNFTDATDYSNLVDFEDGNLIGGINPVNQMDYATNEINVNLAVTGTPNEAFFSIQITPKSQYSGVNYTLTIKEGATVLQQTTGLSGNTTTNYTKTTNGAVTVFVTSDSGLIYDLDLTYRLNNGVINVSEYEYLAVHQLSFPKSTGYGATLVGDVIIHNRAALDMTSVSFEAGKQIRLNFELSSSLVNAFTPSVTFFYNITENYTDLNDFITNSSFKESLEGAFSENFKNIEISNEGTSVTFTGFVVSFTGNNLYIKAPKVVYSVTEQSGITENKNEFYLYSSLDLVLVNQDSFTSLHSNRDYEVALIYMDEKGRKTTALTSPNNSFYIPTINSTTSNKPSITINNNPPSWAKYYKFAIKQVKKEYEIIYGNKVYKEGIYRWIQLVGENKNKVKEGDILILKSDYSGVVEEEVKIKVLEVTTKEANFISGNETSAGKEIIEEPGLYFKIKQGNFDINIDDNSFITYIGRGKRRYATRSFVSTSPIFGEIDETDTFIPTPIVAGTEIRFFVEIKANGAIAFNHHVEIIQTAQDDYASIKAWWEAEVEVLDAWNSFQSNYLRDWDWGASADGQVFRVKAWRDGTASRDIITTVIFDVNFSGGTLVFETTPNENLTDAFYETPEVFTITDGNHQSNPHVLNQAFNCFVFGNGVESFKIQDAFIGKSFSIDSNPTSVDEEGYRQRNRFADITYSGIFNSNTGLNRLNEFNLSLANYKDDIEKIYGSIIKIKGQDTNLEVYQEDKCSIVFYGKDLLYNADGTSNLSRIEDVLGQQKTEGGEYGISSHPDSYDDYAFNTYFTDVKRGVVLKRNYNNGLFEVSFQGMRNYFKKLFRDNTINYINGCYDQFHDYYILHIQYNTTEYVTWVYSNKDNGWLGRLTFSPEDMIRINNYFVSFKNGKIYKHNQTDIYNTFYGIESPSKFSFNFSQNASDRKNFKNISIEGSIPLNVLLETDLDKGYVNQSDFDKKENIYYAYLRNSNDSINTELLSCQGIGLATVNGLILEFGQNLSNEISIGDEIRNTSLQLVGTVQSKTKDTLTLDTVNNITTGDFVLASKPQSIEESNLTGYYMRVDCNFESNKPNEIFAINSEVSKSYE